MNAKKRKRMSKLIDETVDYYRKHPRSMTNTGAVDETCAYNGENGTHCAVGRNFVREVQEQGDGLSWNTQSLEWVNSMIKQGCRSIFWGPDKVTSFDDLLREDVRGFPLNFWASLQVLHDDVDYWDGNELTDSGQAYLGELHNKVEIGDFDHEYTS